MRPSALCNVDIHGLQLLLVTSGNISLSLSSSLSHLINCNLSVCLFLIFDVCHPIIPHNIRMEYNKILSGYEFSYCNTTLGHITQCSYTVGCFKYYSAILYRVNQGIISILNPCCRVIFDIILLVFHVTE